MIALLVQMEKPSPRETGHCGKAGKAGIFLRKSQVTLILEQQNNRVCITWRVRFKEGLWAHKVAHCKHLTSSVLFPICLGFGVDILPSVNLPFSCFHLNIFIGKIKALRPMAPQIYRNPELQSRTLHQYTLLCHEERKHKGYVKISLLFYLLVTN